jgi:HicB family.
MKKAKEKGKSYEQPMNFRVSKEEHAAIKIVAAKEGTSIKKLFFSMLDRFYPGWREEIKK